MLYADAAGFDLLQNEKSTCAIRLHTGGTGAFALLGSVRRFDRGAGQMQVKPIYFFLKVDHSAPERHTEEYRPLTIPMIRGRANSRMEVTPRM